MSDRLPLFDLNFSQDEEDAVLEVLRSRWISMGPKTAALEEAFRARTGAGHAIAVATGTAALHLALAALDIGPGDEVIVPSMSFVATANAVRYVGATPVFADIVGPEDFSIDPEDVERKITGRTRAILPMHYAGFPCDLPRLLSLAQDRGLSLVEDAAHACDSFLQGKHLGTWGSLGCFSFFSNKNVSCAEGGMVVTDDPGLAEKVRLMRSHGMTTVSYDRATGRASSYDVVLQGYSYRLDDLRSSLALCQLDKLAPDTQERSRLRGLYEEALADLSEVIIPYRGVRDSCSQYIFPIVLRTGGSEKRDRVRSRLEAEGIQTSVHYPAIHRFSIYRDPTVSLPRTEHAADHEITLPLFGTMSESQVDRVATALKRALAE
jgi:dTDP-4-amino-4,6-dideoxygalactose transaminase